MCLFAITVLLTIVFTNQVTSAADPPNIVLIYCDDLGYGDARLQLPDPGHRRSRAVCLCRKPERRGT